MTTETRETRGFQAEVAKLLHLMIHSLYSNREIFLRELIANASDAADKLRFEALTHSDWLADDPELRIRIEFDPEAHTITLADNGIGMSRDEVIENLGTIAKSGTADFLRQLSGDQKKDAGLIGQFGVGFYSAFVVADRVEVLSRRAGAAADASVRWESSGEGEFTVETIDKPERGTTIILHLRADSHEFADAWRLRGIIHKYAEHISFPVLMRKPGEDGKPSEEWETVNKATALWTRARSEVTDDEYREFYKLVSHDFTDPLAWSHNKVEGKTEYTSLLYVPGRAPFDLYHREAARGLKLYVQRVFILDNAEQFLPLYLRFMKGVIDSNDLPLNVSREMLQSDPVIDTIKGALTKRVLDMLAKMATGEPDKYATFWEQFGQVMKEGVGEDHANRDKLAKLFRFASTHTGNEKPTVSLDDYIGRMKPEQEHIYFLTADSYAAALASPHLEVFRKKGIEVLLLTDRLDEWMMSYLNEYEGKPLQHIGKGELDFSKLDTDEERKAHEALAKSSEDLVKRLKESLQARVDEVKVTHRLTDSAACLVLREHDLGPQMRELLKSAGQAMPEQKPILEINPEHPLIRRLADTVDGDRFGALANIVLDQATLAEGGALEDPAAYVRRINALLLDVMG